MNIVLGVTGGIAAYKAVLLARLLVEAGHEVHVVPTEDALRFVGKPTWEAISRHPVTTSVHEDVPEVRHVALGQRADLVVVAPATANTLARMTAGLADDLLGTTLLATRAPVLVAPAMHTEMWQHPATQDNVAILRARGVHVVGPESGRLTGDDSGPGRMSEPEAILAAVERLLGADAAGGDETGSDDGAGAAAGEAVACETAAGEAAAVDAAADRETGDGAVRDLDGVRLLVTAGGTREPIDPVRYLGNRSSGRQGVAVAEAAADRGAKVVLLAANIDESVLGGVRDRASVRVVPVSSTAELEAAANAAAAGADSVIMAAAVADYRVANVADEKLRKEDRPGVAPVIELVENPDVLAGLVRNRRAGQVIVGFAAETVSGDASAADGGAGELSFPGSEPGDDAEAAATTAVRTQAISAATMAFGVVGEEFAAGAAGAEAGVARSAPGTAHEPGGAAPTAGEPDASFAADAAKRELLERGRRKIARKGADLLAVNAVGWDAGFESNENTLLVIDAAGDLVCESSGSKRAVAERVLDAVRDALGR